jgi:hypothetical protein
MSPLTVTSANSDCPAPPMPGSPEAPAAVVTPPQISSEQILNLLPSWIGWWIINQATAP